MATIRFILQTPYETGKNGAKKPARKETRLYAYLIVNRDHIIRIKTEHVIRPTEWDFEIQGKVEKLAGSIEFNAKLAALKTEILGQYDKLREQYPDATFQELGTLMKQFFKNKELPKFSDKGFFEVLQEYINSNEGTLTPRTLAKFKTLKAVLTEFTAGNRKYNPLTFSMIDHNFLDAFVKHLREREPRGRQKRRPEGMQTGLLNDSIKKYIEDLKNFMRWAEDRGYNHFQTYAKFKPVSTGNRKRKAERRDIVTLTLQELTQFYQHDFSKRPGLDRVRDIFCFAAFTGQRWSDIERFNKEDVKVDVWAFSAFKTKKRQEVDLTGFAAPALDILRKYDYSLPVISLQKFNEELKDAGKLAGITAPVKLRRYSGVNEITTEEPKHYFMSSHMARRTCVSILLNVFGIPPSLVMEITAHTDLKTLQKYINTDREARKAAMARTTPVTETMRIVKAS
jgi:integrase